MEQREASILLVSREAVGGVRCFQRARLGDRLDVAPTMLTGRLSSLTEEGCEGAYS